jgi:hypothetical protein
MTTPPTTGIEPVDAELERRRPFPSVEAEETLTRQLLAVRQAMQPGSSDVGTSMLQSRRRRK